MKGSPFSYSPNTMRDVMNALAPCISVHFPVGRYPQLYQESEDRIEKKGQRVWSDLVYEHGKLDYGRYRSIFAIPLKRGVWVDQGRRKVMYE